jgi:hypothetical protein
MSPSIIPDGIRVSFVSSKIPFGPFANPGRLICIYLARWVPWVPLSWGVPRSDGVSRPSKCKCSVKLLRTFFLLSDRSSIIHQTLAPEGLRFLADALAAGGGGEGASDLYVWMWASICLIVEFYRFLKWKCCGGWWGCALYPTRFSGACSLCARPPHNTSEDTSNESSFSVINGGAWKN